ncbi:MAG: histidine kinase [Acidobacteria bacterium]|jgi:two-component system, LytTR family, sensor kinase|nr:MAG: histidine kinase [Acidobacteriota bacterium]
MTQPAEMSRVRRQILQVAGVIVGCSIILALIEATQVYLASTDMEPMRITWRVAFEKTMPSWLVLAALTPGILYLSNRFPFERRNWVRSLAVHALAGVVFAFAHLAGTELLYLSVAEKTKGFRSGFSQLLHFYFALDVFTYWAIVAACLGFYYYREYRNRELTASRLQASLTEARLEALRAQLNPHFLFNTLNAISALSLKGEPVVVAEMLGRLSDLLRATLDHGRTQEIPLARELEFLDSYLAIQRLRFGERFTVTQRISPETLDALVPSLILQPIVENAVVHGIGKQLGRGSIDISATRDNGVLRLEVRDSGPGFTALPDEGIGLGNTRSRLEQLYGTGYAFECGRAPEGGAVVRITIPAHLEPRHATA